MKLNVLTFNIHKGYNWNNQKYVLEQIRSLINQSNSDLVFLQEVTGKNTKHLKKGLIDTQFDFLAKDLWPHYAYAENAMYDHGHHGNMILSKYPLEKIENVNLSTNRLEKRGMLFCRVRANDQEFLVGCLHLNLLHTSRKKQYQILVKYLRENHYLGLDPMIIAGDFNDYNKQSSKVFVDKLKMEDAYVAIHKKFAKTFPSVSPFLCLDRIYVKNLKVIHSKVIKIEENLSDHLPLYCELLIE